MKLHLTNADGNNLITGYDKDWVDINRQRFTKSLIILPNQIIEDWGIANFEALTAKSIARLAICQPGIAILGTGEQHRFIHSKFTTALTEIGVSLECMSTAAACRTYNILMGEGRNVAAALLLS
ncbi:MAG: Mth938-like domain-containing protein [Methylotenera sp.]|nr:Mth938-like domain-containing protein [Methylotenera sp.]